MQKKLIIFVFAAAVAAHASIIDRSATTCQVFDSTNTVVSNTCTAPDGVTLDIPMLSTDVMFRLGSGGFGMFMAITNYHPVLSNPFLPGPYFFSYSQSTSGTGWFEVQGAGTGNGFLDVSFQEISPYRTGPVDLGGSVSLALNGHPLGGACQVYGCKIAIPLGVPFQVTGLASAFTKSAFLIPEGNLATMSSFNQFKTLYINGATDVTGNVIAGASMVEVVAPAATPEPGTAALSIAALSALLILRRRSSRC